MTGTRKWNPSVVMALVAAAMLLVAGVLMAIYEERLYSAQQVKNIREQAQILAASVTAAIVFDDRRAAQEYVEALATNPELQAAGVYDGEAHLLAGFSRGGARLPSAAPGEGTVFGPGFMDVTLRASQNGAAVGTVMLLPTGSVPIPPLPLFMPPLVSSLFSPPPMLFDSESCLFT